jgi:hypothetical protein
MNITIGEIKKEASLKVETDLHEKLENVVLELLTTVEVTINDKKVIFEDKTSIYGIMNKDSEELKKEIEEVLNNAIKYVQEKAFNLTNKIFAINNFCEKNNIQFNIKVI